MDKVKGKETPMATSTQLKADDIVKSVDQKLYRSKIGSLLYLTSNRPDILFSTCLYARFQVNPKESHLNAIKKLLRYLLNIVGLYSIPNHPHMTYFPIVMLIM